MEVLKNIWNYVLPVGGGLTVGGILIAIGVLVVKLIIKKVDKKLDIDGALKRQEENADNLANKTVDRIKEVTFTHSIEPLVKSEMQRVYESANENVKQGLAEVHKENAAILAVIEAQAAYFDDSIVSEEKKATLHAAIENAKKIMETPVAEAVVDVAETAVESVKAKKSARKAEVIR